MSFMSDADYNMGPLSTISLRGFVYRLGEMMAEQPKATGADAVGASGTISAPIPRRYLEKAGGHR
jgi:hypothetical protein